MPPTTSDVWKDFIKSADKKSAKCNLCNEVLTYAGTTSNLRSHLRGKHPLQQTDVISDAFPNVKKQVSMTSFVNSPKKVSAAESERITGAIVNMIVKDYYPLSMVESEGFLALLDIVAPNYKVPCRNTVRARIQSNYENEKACLLSELKSVNAASITTDTWTSNSTDSYLTVTEHHIDGDWNMNSNVLMTSAMPERHTGDNIAVRLKECVSEFGLEGKVCTSVHDNARNMECAGEKCEEWDDLGCFGHTLQLCIKPALELPLVAKTVAKCRKLVGHYKHSTTLTAEMRKRQQILKAPAHELIQDVPTRWNSTQLMLERLNEQRRVITDIMLDEKLTKKSDAVFHLKDNEWDIIRDLSNVLKVLTDVTTYMSTEKDISCSEIYPIVCGHLSNCLKIDETDSGIIVRVKDSIASELNRRFKPSSAEIASSTPVLASLLDPRYKRLPFLSSQQRKIAEETLEGRMDEVPLKITTRDTSSDATPQPSKRRKLDFMVFTSPEKEESDELKTFLSEKSDPEAHPLHWWKRNETKFARIAHIARQVLAVPATSVPSERIFSAAGILVNKLRNRLSCDIVDKIIFLNKNIVNEKDECQ